MSCPKRFTEFFFVVDNLVPELTKLTVSQGELITSYWNDLFGQVLTTYRDGYVMKDFDKATIGFDRMFYPKWWLDKVCVLSDCTCCSASLLNHT